MIGIQFDAWILRVFVFCTFMPRGLLGNCCLRFGISLLFACIRFLYLCLSSLRQKEKKLPVLVTYECNCLLNVVLTY